MQSKQTTSRANPTQTTEPLVVSDGLFSGRINELLVCEGGGNAPNTCAHGLALPASERTVYTNSCFKAADLLDRRVQMHLSNLITRRNPRVPFGKDTPWHIVAMEGLVDNVTTQRHVHHFVVYGFKHNDECSAVNATSHPDFIYGWAPGQGPIRLPKEAGAIQCIYPYMA